MQTLCHTISFNEHRLLIELRFCIFFLENVLKKITWILILLNLWVLSSCVAIIGRFAETEIPLNFKNLRKKSRKFPFPFIHLYYTNQLLQWWNKSSCMNTTYKVVIFGESKFSFHRGESSIVLHFRIAL